MPQSWDVQMVSQRSKTCTSPFSISAQAAATIKSQIKRIDASEALDGGPNANASIKESSTIVNFG
jgi:hypothetical protein